VVAGIERGARPEASHLRARLVPDAGLITTSSGENAAHASPPVTPSVSSTSSPGVEPCLACKRRRVASGLPLDTRPVPSVAFPYPGIRFHYAQITESLWFPRFRLKVSTQADPRRRVLLP